MASEVDICNLALAELGNLANISSISPPEASAEAVYCSRFYPTSRDSLLELHDWNFASRRASLALLGDATTQTGEWVNQWRYTYAVPNEMISARKIISPDASDDWSATTPPDSLWTTPFAAPALSGGQGIYTPQAFIVETLQAGTMVIRTNTPSAVLLYTVKVSDPTKFSPLFVQTLSYYLASRLAGPIIKGDTGRAVAKEMLGLANGVLARAAASDANQRRVDIAPAVPWMVAR